MRKLVCFVLIVLLIASAGCVLVHISNIDKQNQAQYELIQAQYNLIQAQDEVIDADGELISALMDQWDRCAQVFMAMPRLQIAQSQSEIYQVLSELSDLAIAVKKGEREITACSYKVHRALNKRSKASDDMRQFPSLP